VARYTALGGCAGHAAGRPACAQAGNGDTACFGVVLMMRAIIARGPQEGKRAAGGGRNFRNARGAGATAGARGGRAPRAGRRR